MRLRLCHSAELENDRMQAEHPQTGDMVLVIRDGKGIHVVDALCPHQYAPLIGGELTDGLLTCSLHGWRFDVTTGESPDFPACLAHWAADVDADGWIWIDEPNAQ